MIWFRFQWLRARLAAILSRLRVLCIRRGWGARSRREFKRIAQSAAILLLATSMLAVPLRPAYSAGVTFTQRTSDPNPLGGEDVGYNSTPSFVDVDGDGDMDVFIGESYGSIVYYENTGTPQAPAFTQRTGAANPLRRRAKITSHFETAELIGVWFDSVVPGRQEIVWMKI